MNRAILIYCTFFISTAFLLTSRGPKFMPFWFSSREIHVEDYTYYLFEHVGLIVLFHIIHVEAKKYQDFCRFMFWFQVFDMVDYMATYNGIWMQVGVLPISANVVGCAVGFLFLLKDTLNKKQ